MPQPLFLFPTLLTHTSYFSKKKTKNKKLTKVNPSFLIIAVTKLHMDCRTQYLQRQQESTNTRDDTKFFLHITYK